MCVKLHKDGIAVANLHPNNIFVDEENLEDVLVTDVGFAYMPGMVSETQIQMNFQAPEIKEKTGIELERIINTANNPAPWSADIKSISLLA